MVKIPLSMGGDLMKALAQQGESSSTKTRVLFVDEEMYGPMEFPKTFLLGRGQVLHLAAYGEVQVSAATIETLHCTKQISKELHDEYKRNPPTSDIDFTNDPAAGGIGADIARSIQIPSCGIRKAAAAGAPRRETECPTPGSVGDRKTPSKFL